jgi:hypothetical protein
MHGARARVLGFIIICFGSSMALLFIYLFIYLFIPWLCNVVDVYAPIDMHIPSPTADRQ